MRSLKLPYLRRFLDVSGEQGGVGKRGSVALQWRYEAGPKRPEQEASMPRVIVSVLHETWIVAPCINTGYLNFVGPQMAQNLNGYTGKNRSHTKENILPIGCTFPLVWNKVQFGMRCRIKVGPRPYLPLYAPVHIHV